MNQYILGSAGGIIFTWAAMILSFLWQNSLKGHKSEVSRMATAFFIAQINIGFIYTLLFLLKGEAPGELRAIEKAIHLPPNIFIWLTFGLTILLLALFLKKLKRRIKFEEFFFFLFLFLVSLIFIGVIGELDKKLWPKFPQIKIGKMEAPTECRESSLSNPC